MEKVNKPMLVEDGHLPKHTERGRRRCEECAGAPPQWHRVLNIRVLNNGLVNSEANNGRLGKGGSEHRVSSERTHAHMCLLGTIGVTANRMRKGSRVGGRLNAARPVVDGAKWSSSPKPIESRVVGSTSRAAWS